MPNYFFDDVLRATNSHLGVNHWSPPSAKWDKLSLNFKSAPSKGLNVDYSMVKQEEWDVSKNEAKASEKNTTTIARTKDGKKYTFAMASDAFKQGVAGNLFNDGWKIDGAIALEQKPIKKEWKHKGTLSAASPVMSDKMRLWFNAEVEYNQKKETTSTAKLSVSYDQWHAGVAGQMKGDKIEKKHAQVCYNDKNAQYFARSDLAAQTAGMGCSIEHDSFTHSYEAVYDWTKDAKGIKGTPVSIIGGGDYDLSKQTGLSYNWFIGETWNYNQSVAHKMTDNWSVSANQAFDAGRLNGKQPAYDLGFSLTYKL